jgi:hypothetical protein
MVELKSMIVDREDPKTSGASITPEVEMYSYLWYIGPCGTMKKSFLFYIL